MKVTLEKQEKFNSLIFNVKSDSSQLIYTCKKNLLPFNNTYNVYDERKNIVAKVKESVFSDTLYRMYIANEIVDKVKVHTKTPLKKYQLENKKWIIEGDITYTKYSVYDEQKGKVLDMFLKPLLQKYEWEITICTEKDMLLCIMTALTIVRLSDK